MHLELKLNTAIFWHELFLLIYSLLFNRDSRFDDLLVELLCTEVTLTSVRQLSLVKMEGIFFLDPNVMNI